MTSENITTKKYHWDNIYTNKKDHEVSWTQETPSISLKIIDSLHLNKDAKIIDIGAGNSRLMEHLLLQGYTNLTVLDISETAIENAKKRMGVNAKKINWVVSDVLDFNNECNYDLWHDRACFHFFTNKIDIAKYIDVVNKYVTSNLVIGTFSLSGPLKCSGLEITQYSEEKMQSVFETNFRKIECYFDTHKTPFDTNQDFIFCNFIKRN